MPQRRRSTVVASDPDAEVKKLIEWAYCEGESLGLAMIWTEDEAGPYFIRPYSRQNWAAKGQMQRQPHEYVHNDAVSCSPYFPRQWRVACQRRDGDFECGAASMVAAWIEYGRIYSTHYQQPGAGRATHTNAKPAVCVAGNDSMRWVIRALVHACRYDAAVSLPKGFIQLPSDSPAASNDGRHAFPSLHYPAVAWGRSKLPNSALNPQRHGRTNM